MGGAGRVILRPMRCNASLLLLLCACAGTQTMTEPQASPEDAPAAKPDPAEPAPPADTGDQSSAIAAMIDDWHGAAAEADEARYMGHFTADAVFMGTDASERWTRQEFEAYVQTYFPQGGWTYEPHDRHIRLSSSGQLAWFDEQLTNAGYGELRGTGVCRRVDGVWRIAHYSMTFTIPNETAKAVVGLIKAGEGER